MLRETEEELIHAAQAGNIAAFERLIRPVERQMLAVAAGIARNKADAEDIFQDAMISAFRGLGSFNRGSRFGTWLHRIVVNTALSYRRKLKRLWYETSELEKGVDYEEQHCTDVSRPEDSFLNNELNTQLATALGTLSERERIAFVLCHQQEFKIREAAQVMDCNENTVKQHLFRARAKLQKQLDPYYR